MPDPVEPSQVIPVVDEFVTVDKIAVQTDAVRVHTTVKETEVLVEEFVTREALKVTRVQLNHPVDVVPPPREEGDTTIISLVEERLVVEKRLFVVEEIHVTRDRVQERVAVPVTVRAMRATVERPLEVSKEGDKNNG